MSPRRTSLCAAITLALVGTTTSAALAQDNMQAGGLAPPPPLPPSQPPPPTSSTETNLDTSKKKDSGRGLEWVYIEAEGGIQHVGLQTFNIDEQNFSAGFIETRSTGPVAGVGLGARLIFITIGARARVGFFDSWDIFSVGGELGLHIPLGNLEPHFELGGGYTALGSFKSSVQNGAVQSALDQTQIRGFYVRGGAGFDYYVTRYFSIGVSASFEVLGLTRPGVDPAKIAEIKAEPSITELQRKQADLLALEGTSFGAAGVGTAVLGLHF